MLVTALLVAVGCHPAPILPVGDTAPPEDLGSDVDLYDPDHVLEVAIELDPDDWDALRTESRNIVEELAGDCLSGPIESPFDWVRADVTLDGETVTDVAVRKKGLLGSDNPNRPSLKVDFGEYEEGQDWHGWERLTLNNANQDPSVIHQCLGYGLFAAAGLPSSRCSFAHVTVNGQDLGAYANVEPVREELLGRFFERAGGPLYEGTLSDFRDGWVDTFAYKGDGADEGRAGLEAVVDALARPDDEVLDALGGVVDLDAFFTFWAMEILVGHWDGYSTNTNNFYVYQDPATDLVHFLPWGIDAILEGDHPFGATYPNSVMARSALPRRLYLLDEGRERYMSRLRELLDIAWDEGALAAETDRMADLVAPYVSQVDPPTFEAGVDAVRAFVGGRRQAILAELDAGGAGWTEDLPTYPCLEEVGSVRGTFDTTWGTFDDASWSGEATLEFTLGGWDYPLSWVSVGAGVSDGQPLVLLVGYLDAQTAIAPYFLLDDPALRSGETFPVDWNVVRGYLGYADATTEFAIAGYLYDGHLTLDAFGTTEGDRITGSFDVKVYGGTE